MTDFKYYGSVSHATMRIQDLVPALLDVLRDLDPAAYCAHLASPFGPVPPHAQEDDGAGWWDSEEAVALLEGLIDDLSDCAPEGYYFGVHPGDGSDFGFWEIVE